MLGGAYDSDSGEEHGSSGTPAVFAKSKPVPPAPPQRAPPGSGGKTEPESLRAAAQTAVADEASRRILLGSAGLPALPLGSGGRHTSACECEDCEGLMARFVAKSLQTKGIRFKCKLCSELVARKADAADHMQDAHSSELQVFKRQKQPTLFDEAKKVVPAAKKFSFARADVLGKKRTMEDVEDNKFAGWAKKEKPEPPPCEQEGYQDQMQQNEVLSAPPWMNQPVPLSQDTEATDTEKVVDQHVVNAQAKRFTSRNILEVKKDVVRCKLCYKTFGNGQETEKHIIEAHRDEFEKELQIWHRFLHTMSKRQPPFGWVCKICNLFFPTDNSTWRHIGKEVFIRREERHLDLWKEKEDRWGHEADQECCGDGMNSNGLSFDSIKQIQEQTQREEGRQLKLKAAADAAGAGCADEDSDSEDSDEAVTAGKKKMIDSF